MCRCTMRAGHGTTIQDQKLETKCGQAGKKKLEGNNLQQYCKSKTSIIHPFHIGEPREKGGNTDTWNSGSGDGWISG